MEWESTISSGRSTVITPPAEPGLGELGLLMVWAIPVERAQCRRRRAIGADEIGVGPGYGVALRVADRGRDQPVVDDGADAHARSDESRHGGRPDDR